MGFFLKNNRRLYFIRWVPPCVMKLSLSAGRVPFFTMQKKFVIQIYQKLSFYTFSLPCAAMSRRVHEKTKLPLHFSKMITMLMCHHSSFFKPKKRNSVIQNLSISIDICVSVAVCWCVYLLMPKKSSKTHFFRNKSLFVFYLPCAAVGIFSD